LIAGWLVVVVGGVDFNPALQRMKLTALAAVPE
jgi:hypothetical protein